MNLQEKITEINGTIQSTSHCLCHGGYNHDAACHVPELLEIAKEYLALLSVLDSIATEEPQKRLNSIKSLSFPESTKQVIAWLLA